MKKYRLFIKMHTSVYVQANDLDEAREVVDSMDIDTILESHPLEDWYIAEAEEVKDK